MATEQPTKATEAEKNYAIATAGISAISSIAGALMTSSAYEAQLEAQTASKIASMGNVLTSYEVNASKLAEDYKLLDSMFADKISERSIQGMKDHARMRAAAAETGTYGGTTDQAVNEAFMTQILDVAVINKERNVALIGISRKSEAAKANAVSQFESLASGGTNVQANALMSGLSGATSALGGLLATMPNSVKASIFDTSVEDVDQDFEAPYGFEPSYRDL